MTLLENIPSPKRAMGRSSCCWLRDALPASLSRCSFRLPRTPSRSLIKVKNRVGSGPRLWLSLTTPNRRATPPDPHGRHLPVTPRISLSFPCTLHSSRSKLLQEAYDAQSMSSRQVEGGTEAGEGAGEAGEVLRGAGGPLRGWGEGAPASGLNCRLHPLEQTPGKR